MNQLCRPEIGEGILAALAYNHERLVWHCRLGLLMPDHLHAIIAFASEAGMRTTISHWKRFVARKFAVNWQRDFFDHRLRDPHELHEKIEYILMNPARKGLCKPVEEWRWTFRSIDRPPPKLD